VDGNETRVDQGSRARTLGKLVVDRWRSEAEDQAYKGLVAWPRGRFGLS
jgi:hypothetical protein